jgi:hypothetical protein
MGLNMDDPGAPAEIMKARFAAIEAEITRRGLDALFDAPMQRRLGRSSHAERARIRELLCNLTFKDSP